MVQKILLQIEIDDSALDAAQAKADKLIATLKEAEALTAALENAVAIDCDDFAERMAAVKALAKEKPPEGGKSAGNVEVKDWTPPEGYGSCAHAWDANFWKQATDAVKRCKQRQYDNAVGEAVAKAIFEGDPSRPVEENIDEAIINVARDIFKPPD